MDIEIYTGDRAALLPLFALADDSPSAVAAYMPLGEVLVARDGAVVVGHAQIVATAETDTLELKSLAVLEPRQSQGVGRDLVAATAARCRDRGARRLIVSTAAAGIGTLRFYQRQGFRMERIVRDAFGPHTGYPEGLMVDGIPLRDQVFLDMVF
ncbi:MAG: GNAT family N-acetyltransferase [Proteobacteria bacterium]|nr:GNAT family N-acetyltransferase [Pseudomonadota bacterium]